MSMNGHIPVLLEEVMEYLDVQRKGIYVDCTIGLGGHALEILKRSPESTLIGFDVDELSLNEARKRLKPFASRVTLYHSDFRYLPDLKLDFLNIRGVLLDLGVSSFQLDSAERGFSFNRRGPLDMRMDLRNKITAEKIVNKYSEARLAQIFSAYGELKQAKRLAHAIVSKRKNKKITTTTELLLITEEICRWRPQKGKTHPAAKVFQALRIEVNQELESLSEFIKKTIQRLPKGARFLAISFHSLEDRIIKHTFTQLATSSDSPPLVKLLTKKPVIPQEKEISENFRARSAKLRAVEKI